MNTHSAYEESEKEPTSFAIGGANTASAPGAVAIGHWNVVEGKYSMAFGSELTVLEDYTLKIGSRDTYLAFKKGDDIYDALFKLFFPHEV